MREAVIVSTARTPITKAQRGEFNLIAGPTLAAHAVRAAVERAGLTRPDRGRADRLRLSRGRHRPQHRPPGRDPRRAARVRGRRHHQPLLRLGPAGHRFGGARIVMDGAPAMIAGGVECVSQIRTRDDGVSGLDPWLLAHKPELYLPMIETADIVAARYGISREAQDRYAAQSQQRTEAAQAAGRYREEIIPVTTVMAVTDRATGAASEREVTVDRDTCNRPGTTYEALAALKPVRGDGQFVTAGNASQLSDGAAACVLMEAAEARRAGIAPLGVFRAWPSPAASPTRWASAPSMPCQNCWRGMA